MHQLMQDYQKNAGVFERRANDEWSADDLCLTMESDEFHRGRIIKTDLMGARVQVLLIDKGYTIVVEYKDLWVIPEPLAEAHPGYAEKVRLHGVNPPEGHTKWPVTAIEMFTQAVRYFPTLKIKYVEGYSNRHNSAAGLEDRVSVLLYGVTYESYGANRQEIYHNINDFVIAIGYARCTALDMTYYATAADEPMQGLQVSFESWLPAEAITVKEFYETPTNVDRDGIIYIKSDRQRDALGYLESTLEAFYVQQPTEDASKNLVVGQPVVVLNQWGTGEE